MTTTPTVLRTNTNIVGTHHPATEERKKTVLPKMERGKIIYADRQYPK